VLLASVAALVLSVALALNVAPVVALAIALSVDVPPVIALAIALSVDVPPVIVVALAAFRVLVLAHVAPPVAAQAW
jgi:hypothetical protein